MAKQIIFRSLLLSYIILMISMGNFVFCDNTPNEVTPTAESKDNLDIAKMIKQYFEGSIHESKLINFIKNNVDNFALNENLEFSDKESVKELQGLEKKALECIELGLWCFTEPERCSVMTPEQKQAECHQCDDYEEEEWLKCLRISKTCHIQIDEKKVGSKDECLQRIADGEIDIISEGDLSVAAIIGITIGAIVVLAVGALLVFLFIKKRGHETDNQ